MKKKIVFFVVYFSISFAVQSQVQIYFNDFESAGGFFTDTTGSLWEQGAPQKSVIDTAYSDQGVWITDLDSVYQGVQNSYLYSPQIIIAPFDSGYISFRQFVDLDTALLGGKDICSVEYRKGADTNWLSLGYQGFAGTTNWFNANSAGTMGWHYDSSGWFQSRFPFYRNQTGSYFYQTDTVQFRFVFRTYANHSGDGWAIDDFGVYGWNMSVDLGIAEITNPADTTIICKSVAVSFKIENFGTDTLYHTACSVYIDSALIFTEQINLPAGLPPDSTTLISLTNKFASPAHDYNLMIKCSTLNDIDTFNNTLSKNISAKHGPKDLKIVHMEANPSRTVGNITYTCYKYITYVSMTVVNTGTDTVDKANFNYRNYKFLNFNISQNNQTINLAPGDSLYFTFVQPYQIMFFGGLYRLTTKVEINYPGYIYKDTASILLVALQIPSKGDTITSDSLEKWCPSGGFIEEKERNYHLDLFPNPATDKLRLSLSDQRIEKGSIIRIYGVCGKEVKRIKINKSAQSIDIDISQLVPGIYYLQLKNKNKILGKGRFIKNR